MQPSAGSPASQAPAEPRTFARLRTRTLLGWPALLAAVTGLLVVVRTPGEAAGEVALGYLVYAIVLLWIVRACRRAGVHLRALVAPAPLRDREWRLVLLALPLLAFSLGALWVVLLPLSWIAPDVAHRLLQGADLAGAAPRTPALTLLVALQTVVLAPVVEEILFRGILLHRFVEKWGTRTGIAASTVAFAVVHIDVLGAAAFALAMTLVYVRARTLLVPIACHALYNGVLVMGGALGGPSREPLTLAAFQRDWWVAVVALAFSVPVLVAAARRLWPAPGWRLPYHDGAAA